MECTEGVGSLRGCPIFLISDASSSPHDDFSVTANQRNSWKENFAPSAAQYYSNCLGLVFPVPLTNLTMRSLPSWTCCDVPTSTTSQQHPLNLDMTRVCVREKGNFSTEFYVMSTVQTVTRNRSTYGTWLVTVRCL